MKKPKTTLSQARRLLYDNGTRLSSRRRYLRLASSFDELGAAEVSCGGERLHFEISKTMLTKALKSEVKRLQNERSALEAIVDYYEDAQEKAAQ